MAIVIQYPESFGGKYIIGIDNTSVYGFGLFNTSSDPVNYEIACIDHSAGDIPASWFSVNPASGSIAGGNSVNIDVDLNIDELPPSAILGDPGEQYYDYYIGVIRINNGQLEDITLYITVLPDYLAQLAAFQAQVDALETALTAPTLAVANDLTGTSFTATITGAPDTTNKIYYRLAKPGVAWTYGGLSTGNGAVQVTALAPGLYEVQAVAQDNGRFSLPSTCQTVQVAAPESISELILRNLQATLEGVTEESGFHNTIRAVYRGSHTPTGEMPCVVLHPSETKDPYQTEGYMECNLTVAVEAWLEDHAALQTQIGRLEADIYAAVMADPQRNGLAIDTLVMRTEGAEDPESTGEAVKVCTIAVHYRHLAGSENG